MEQKDVSQNTYQAPMSRFEQSLAATHESYLKVQFGISRELIRLHRGLPKVFQKDGNEVFLNTCIRLSEHQQQMQKIEELRLQLLSQGIHESPRGIRLETLPPKPVSPEKSLDGKPIFPESKKISTSQIPDVKTPAPSISKSVIPSKKPLPLPRLAGHGETVSIPRKENPVEAESLKNSGEQKTIREFPKKTRPTRFRYRFESFSFQLLQKWSEQASEQSVSRFRNVLAFSLYRIFRLRRKVVEANLDWAMPELSPARRRRIAKGCYQWGAEFAMDVLRMRSWQGKLDEKVHFQNLELLEEALKEKRGVLMIGAHFGNWEPLCPALTEKGFSTAMYVGAQTNPLTDLLQNQTRRQWKIETIEKGSDATMRIWDALKQNRVVGMLVDQDERKKGVFVDFFGQAASSNTGAAAFHLMQQSPVLLFTSPYIRNRIEFRFERVHFQKTGNQEDDLKKLTQKMLAGLEKMIRRHPEQYFWMHKRWRTRPQDDSSSPY